MKNKIEYAEKDVLSDDEFDPKHTKFRVTMYVDLDVLNKIREMAASAHLPYQTFINQELRKIFLGSGKISGYGETVEKLYGYIKDLGKRVEDVESVVRKHRTRKPLFRSSREESRIIPKGKIKRHSHQAKRSEK